MARISTYPIDNNVTFDDKWIGTDANGSVTKNFTPEGIASWINSANAVGIAGQMNFRFQADILEGREDGTISLDGGSASSVAFNSLTTIKVNKYNVGVTLINTFLQVMLNEYVLLCKIDNINLFGIYKVTSIVQDTDEPDFYDLGLTHVASNGSLEEDKVYGLISWPYNSAESSLADKHYTHNQNNAATIWNVTHNLGKYPSVSVVLSTGKQGIAEVDHINNNSLTITLMSAESGKAYLN